MAVNLLVIAGYVLAKSRRACLALLCLAIAMHWLGGVLARLVA